MHHPTRRARLLAPITIATVAACGVEEPAAPPAATFGTEPTPVVVTSDRSWTEEEIEQRGLLLHEPGAQAGYTLVAPFESDQVFLVGMDGEVAHQWEAPETMSPYLTDEGNLLRCAEAEVESFYGGGVGGRIDERTWNGELVWEYDAAEEHVLCQHHDIEPMPNGNVLFIAWEYKTAEEAIARGRDPERVLAEEGFWPDMIVEVRPTPPSGGEVVWQWHAWDHLVQTTDPELPGFGNPAEHPGRLDINRPAERDEEETEERDELEDAMAATGYAGDEPDDAGEGDEVASADGDGEDEDDGGMRFSQHADWLHLNSIAYEPELDLIVVSSPELCEVLVIDHSTTTEEAAGSTGGRWGRGGEILFRWGNPENYGAGGPDDKQLFYQHNAQWLPGPRLVLFNNGEGRANDEDWSSVDELWLPFNAELGFERPAPGVAFRPSAPAWSFRAPDELFSSFISGADRLPNGNTTLCAGASGRLLEVTPTGQEVWRFHSPLGGEGLVNAVHEGEDPSDEPATGEGEGEGEAEGEGGEDDEGGGGPMIDPRAMFRGPRVPAGHPGLARLE